LASPPASPPVPPPVPAGGRIVGRVGRVNAPENAPDRRSLNVGGLEPSSKRDFILEPGYLAHL
jgi:hypothetical protein